MSRQLATIFRSHDKGQKQEALEACEQVDALQFQYLDEEEVHLAASAFINALWAKDDVEFQYLRGGSFDTEGIREADYGQVTQKLRERASIIGAHPNYAVKKTQAWRRHKTGGDYWTPYQQAQMYELRAALQEPEYPKKPRNGSSGPGPEPMRYVLASELHDMRSERYWKQGIDVLVPYYQRILEEYEDE